MHCKRRGFQGISDFHNLGYIALMLVVCCADEGLQGFTAVFDVVDQPHWLKCFVLRFWVLIANKLDQDAPLCSNSVVSLAQGKADSMAPTKLASKSGRDSNDSQYQRKQQAAGGIAHQPSSLSQASERGWLPPALLPPKSDSNGKQKLPKKSMKQRVGQAEDGRESSLPAAAKAQSSPTSDSWTTGETEINGIDCRGAAAMSETSDDGEVSSSRPPMASLSLKALQTNGMANGHSGRHTRNSSRDSQDSGACSLLFMKGVPTHGILYHGILHQSVTWRNVLETVW